MTVLGPPPDQRVKNGPPADIRPGHNLANQGGLTGQTTGPDPTGPQFSPCSVPDKARALLKLPGLTRGPDQASAAIYSPAPVTRTAAGDNQARTAAHLLSPEPVPGSPEPSGPPPGQLTGWQDHARASAAIYSPAPATGQLQPAFKLERSLTQSHRAETVAGYPKPSGPPSGATGRRRAVVGGQAGEDSDSPAPAGVVRGSGLRRKSRAGPSRTRP